MSRRLRIEWRPGLKVTALLDMPRAPHSPAFLIASGAGAGQTHSFMAGVRERIAAAGFPAMTFDYPYREADRRAPDRADVLLACHRVAADRLRRYDQRVVLAGKSMGGRMATHLAATGYPAAGLVVYGYPLVAIGKTRPRPTDHLDEIDVPALFFQGAKDRMAPIELIEPVVKRMRWSELQVIPEADHSFKVPKRAGIDEAGMLDLLVERTIAWVR
ncbi:dienelactone hydrolase family protein [bacterium]|nr:dienelactone hydrolase family protein [bacterium]